MTFFQIIRELKSYEAHVNSSFSHVWKLPDEQEDMVHYTAPTYGVDANPNIRCKFH